jgi:large subunit ribosomal protein L33
MLRSIAVVSGHAASPLDEPTRTDRSRRNMAKSNGRELVILKSTESAYCYTTTKNPRKSPGKLERKKYDPVVRRHVLFREKR